MKSLLYMTGALVVIYLQNVTAIPHGVHRNLHKKMDYTTDIVTTTTTVVLPEVVIWVDGNGNVVSTQTLITTNLTMSTPAPDSVSTTPVAVITPSIATNLPSSTRDTDTEARGAAFTSSTAIVTAPPTTEAAPTSTSDIASSASPTPPARTPTTSIAPPAGAAQGAPTVLPATNKPAASATENGGLSSIVGIAYDILKGATPGACKDDSDVQADILKFSQNGFNLVRIYGVDCNQVQLVTKHASHYGMQVFVTINDLVNFQSDIQTIFSQAGSNLASINTIAIGNEQVNDGTNPGAVVDALNLARAFLVSLNFSGSIVTVDTFGMLIKYPELCAASDYCAANCHGYFTSSVAAEFDGAYVHQQMQGVSAANNGKRTVITESGWPWQGQSNSAAIASPQNQAVAIASLKAAFPNGDLILFEAFNADYKLPGGYGVEPFWGIYGY